MKSTSELHEDAPSFVAGRPVSALDHPLRREVCILLRERERPASDLAATLRTHPPTLSHHLGILLSVGLVRVRVAGRRRIYQLVPSSALAAWERWLDPGRGRPPEEAA
jgi:DNA-binding transcriptional ArsR family regulator